MEFLLLLDPLLVEWFNKERKEKNLGLSLDIHCCWISVTLGSGIARFNCTPIPMAQFKSNTAEFRWSKHTSGEKHNIRRKIANFTFDSDNQVLQGFEAIWRRWQKEKCHFRHVQSSTCLQQDGWKEEDCHHKWAGAYSQRAKRVRNVDPRRQVFRAISLEEWEMLQACMTKWLNETCNLTVLGTGGQ